jgi:hypothetical protein
MHDSRARAVADAHLARGVKAQLAHADRSALQPWLSSRRQRQRHDTCTLRLESPEGLA